VRIAVEFALLLAFLVCLPVASFAELPGVSIQSLTNMRADCAKVRDRQISIIACLTDVRRRLNSACLQQPGDTTAYDLRGAIKRARVAHVGRRLLSDYWKVDLDVGLERLEADLVARGTDPYESLTSDYGLTALVHELTGPLIHGAADAYHHYEARKRAGQLYVNVVDRIARKQAELALSNRELEERMARLDAMIGELAAEGESETSPADLNGPTDPVTRSRDTAPDGVLNILGIQTNRSGSDLVPPPTTAPTSTPRRRDLRSVNASEAPPAP
jgi:hypothetical protein